MTISSLGDANVNSALSVLIPRSLNFKFSLKMDGSSYSATDELFMQRQDYFHLFFD